ncbi:MAG: hypothetical protein WD696_17620, partial [Bryobacteraceae bacterium]
TCCLFVDTNVPLIMRGCIVSQGRMRRAVQPQYKLLELWRDGCLIFLADGAEFLCRDIEDKQKLALRINPLVLAESTCLFCELARKIYEGASPRSHLAQYMIEFRNLSVNKTNPVLTPVEVGSLPWPSTRSYEAEYSGERFTVTADPGEDAAITAFQLVSEVYTWFGIEQDEIPYTIESHGRRVIDVGKFRSQR